MTYPRFLVATAVEPDVEGPVLIQPKYIASVHANGAVVMRSGPLIFISPDEVPKLAADLNELALHGRTVAESLALLRQERDEAEVWMARARARDTEIEAARLDEDQQKWLLDVQADVAGMTRNQVLAWTRCFQAALRALTARLDELDQAGAKPGGGST